MNANNLCVVDSLEARRFLAANAALIVVGTSGDDTISVVLTGDSLIVTQNGQSKTRDAANFRRITVNGRDGDDVIDLSRAGRRCSVDAGDGEDTITGSARPDVIHGGADDDLIRGMAGNDRLKGEDGDDTIRGGFGDDRIDGGDDRDRLFGSEGDDFLDANDNLWEDDVIGGLGFDTAEVDDGIAVEDDVEGVEDVND